MFTSTAETIVRKVLYYTTDNQLSGKLETAIQALDNLTKVHYAFMSPEPSSSGGGGQGAGGGGRSTVVVTPERRYDAHLVPYAILAGEQEAMKRCYSGISENIAGLLEHILSLKAILKDVYQSNSLNETAFEASRRAYVRGMLEVRRHTADFRRTIVENTLAAIDERVDEMRRLNRTVAAAAAAVVSNFAAQESVAVSAYTEAYNSALAFTRHVQQYLRDMDVQKSMLSGATAGAVSSSGTAGSEDGSSSGGEASTSSATVDEETSRSAVRSLVDAIDALRRHAVDLRSEWRRLEEAIKATWRRFLSEDLLRNFYLNLYNDVTDMVNHPQRTEVFKALFYHPKILGPPTSATAGGGGRGGGYAPSTFYALLNADVPIINADVKMNELSQEFAQYALLTDVERVVNNRDRRLADSFGVLRTNLNAFRTQCQLGADLVR